MYILSRSSSGTVDASRSGVVRALMCAIAVALSFTACGPDGGDTEPDSVTRADDRANQPKNHPPKNQPQRQQGATVVDPEVLARGRVAWRACAKCHCASDPRIAQDTDWVCLNETTACIAQGKPAPGLRAAILAYLNHADTLRPILVGRDALTDDPAKLGRQSQFALERNVPGVDHDRAPGNSVIQRHTSP